MHYGYKAGQSVTDTVYFQRFLTFQESMHYYVNSYTLDPLVHKELCWNSLSDFVTKTQNAYCNWTTSVIIKMASGAREPSKVTSGTIHKHNQKLSKASTDHILTFKNI